MLALGLRQTDVLLEGCHSLSDTGHSSTRYPLQLVCGQTWSARLGGLLAMRSASFFRAC